MKREPRESGTAKMRPRARLIGMIGEELISDEPVALVELVKNSYDADATRVDIRFERQDAGPISKIIVEDDGHGMDLKTVLEGWFEPGTNLKGRSDHSPKGRVYQGAKGIGRFASARLAQSLTMTTHKGGTTVTAIVDWGRFDEQSYLDEVEVVWEAGPDPGSRPGTRLELDGVRKNWSVDDFELLHARLSRLVSPFEDVTDFSVNLYIPGDERRSGEVAPPPTLLRPKYRLVGSLSSVGEFTGSIESEIGDGAEFIAKKVWKERTPACGPFEVEVRAWDRDQDSLGPLGESTNLSIAELRKQLNTYSGVSIYRDGFRVHPYGDTGHDWLGLDIRSRLNPRMRLANNQVVAAIKVSRSGNPGLRDRSTREGMVRNDAHTALEDWFKRVLELLEDYRDRNKPAKRDGDAELGQPLFDPLFITDIARKASRQLGKKHAIAKLLVERDDQVRKAIERIQETFSSLLLLSGLGHQVDVVIHEIGAPLGKINRYIDLLEAHCKSHLLPIHVAEAQEKIDGIRSWLDQIYGLRERLDPQTPAKRGKATSFDIRDEIEGVRQLYSALIAKQGIKWEVVAPKPVMVKMSRAVVAQILANLVDNSIFWIRDHLGHGKGGKIQVETRRIKTGFSLSVSDNGPGIDPDDLPRAFEPYFTRKPNGIGLGLHIARLLIEPYGKLVYEAEGPLPGATFVATFVQKVGL